MMVNTNQKLETVAGLEMSTTEWVHDKVAQLLGFSEDSSVEFIIMTGKFNLNTIYVT